MASTLTRQALEEAVRSLTTSYRSEPALVVSPSVMKALQYQQATVTVWTLPGAVRRRGPDGRTWIEKRWRTADVARGGGNRAKRRAGLVPHYGLFGDMDWVPAGAPTTKEPTQP